MIATCDRPTACTLGESGGGGGVPSQSDYIQRHSNKVNMLINKTKKINNNYTN